MTQINLELDKKASESLNELMKHYNAGSRADIISKAIAVLKIAAHVGKTGGELYARKGNHETKIVVT